MCFVVVCINFTFEGARPSKHRQQITKVPRRIAYVNDVIWYMLQQAAERSGSKEIGSDQIRSDRESWLVFVCGFITMSLSTANATKHKPTHQENLAQSSATTIPVARQSHRVGIRNLYQFLFSSPASYPEPIIIYL